MQKSLFLPHDFIAREREREKRLDDSDFDWKRRIRDSYFVMDLVKRARRFYRRFTFTGYTDFFGAHNSMSKRSAFKLSRGLKPALARALVVKLVVSPFYYVPRSFTRNRVLNWVRYNGCRERHKGGWRRVNTVDRSSTAIWRSPFPPLSKKLPPTEIKAANHSQLATRIVRKFELLSLRKRRQVPRSHSTGYDLQRKQGRPFVRQIPTSIKREKKKREKQIRSI